MTDFPGFTDYQQTAQQEPFFPPKPALNKPADALSRSIMSLLFFALAGYYFFGKDLAMLSIVIVVIFIHEMGHFLAMKIFRYSDVKMFFVPLFGAYVTGKKTDISQRQRVIIILAGPVPGIIIGAIAYLAGLAQQNELLLRAGGVFLFINVFNLLPVTPLDGGNLISVLFFQTQRVLHLIFTILSIVLMTAFAVYSENWFLLILPFFMAMRLSGNSKYKSLREQLFVDNLNYDKPVSEMTDREYWLIRARVIENFVTFRNIDSRRYEPVRQEQQIVNIMEQLQVPKIALDLRIGEKLLYLFIWLLFLAGPIAAGVYIRIERQKQIQEEREQLIREIQNGEQIHF